MCAVPCKCQYDVDISIINIIFVGLVSALVTFCLHITVNCVVFRVSPIFLSEINNRYDPLSSCLVDFKGRANMASVKNCQFVVSEPASEASNTGITCYLQLQAKYYSTQHCC